MLYVWCSPLILPLVFLIHKSYCWGGTPMNTRTVVHNQHYIYYTSLKLNLSHIHNDVLCHALLVHLYIQRSGLQSTEISTSTSSLNLSHHHILTYRGSISMGSLLHLIFYHIHTLYPSPAPSSWRWPALYSMVH